MRIPNPTGSKADAVHIPSLPALLYVCGSLMGFIPHQARNRARKNGTASHTISSPHQHIHVCQVSKTNIHPSTIYILCYVQGSQKTGRNRGAMGRS